VLSSVGGTLPPQCSYDQASYPPYRGCLWGQGSAVLEINIEAAQIAGPTIPSHVSAQVTNCVH
jgi:hypothetical protein